MRDTIWRDWRIWAVVGAVFSLFGLMNAAQMYFNMELRGAQPRWWPTVGATMPFWLAKALLLPGVVWAGRRFPIGRSAWALRLLPHIPLSVLYSAGHITLGVGAMFLLLGPPRPDTTFGFELVRFYTLYLLAGIVYYWAFLGTVQAFDYYQQFRERERAAAELEIKASGLAASLAHARLDALRMQLNPHFLFNTLNSISVLAAKQRTEMVVRMLTRLSEVLRMTLDRTEHLLALRKELSFIEKYLEIEQVRFGDRLTVEQQVEPAALDAEVPSFILQPLVENALKHGLGGIRGPVSLEIGARVEQDRVVLWVSDSGRGFPPALRARSGIGLTNTRARLERLYGQEYRLEFSPPGAGATVRVELPLRSTTSASLIPLDSSVKGAA